jgi:hypothetical protein
MPRSFMLSPSIIAIEIVYSFLIASMRATCLAHHTLLYFLAPVI